VAWAWRAGARIKDHAERTALIAVTLDRGYIASACAAVNLDPQTLHISGSRLGARLAIERARYRAQDANRTFIHATLVAATF